MLVNTNISKSVLFIAIWVMISSSAFSQIWTLEQCIDSAKVSNKQLQISSNQILITKEKQKEIKANLLPKITANGDYKYYADLPTQLMPLSIFGGPEGQFKEAQFGVDHNINANLQFAMPLYKPEIYGGIEATKIVGKIANLNYQKTEEEVYFDVANLYYNAQIIQSQISFLDSNLINSKALLGNVTLLHEQLIVKQTDVDRIALQVQQITTKIAILKSKHEQVINALKLIMGVSANQIVEVEQEIVQSEIVEYATRPSIDFQLVDTRFSLLSSELKTLKKSRYLPSAYLYGSYGVMGYGFDKAPNEFLNFYALGFVGVKFSYPIFNGMVTNKKINQKRLELTNVDLQKNLVKEQQEMKAKNAQLNKSIAEKSIQETLKQIDLAQRIYNKVLLQQQEGVANLTDILLANNAIRDAQQSYIGFVIDYLKADLELKKITGNIK